MTPDAAEAAAASNRFTPQFAASRQELAATAASAQPNRVAANEARQADDTAPLVFTPGQVEELFQS